MASTAPAKKRASWVDAAVFVGIYLFFQVILPAPEPITKSGMGVLGFFFGTLYMWIRVDIGWPSLFVLGLICFTGVTTPGTLFSKTWGNSMVPFLICAFLFVGNPMLHTGPEIHGHSTKLYLHRKVFHSIQTIYRHSYDHMIAPISIWLRISNVIPFFDHYQITLTLQKFCQIIDIIYKIADYPDTCNILKIILRIHHSRFFSLSL